MVKIFKSKMSTFGKQTKRAIDTAYAHKLPKNERLALVYEYLHDYKIATDKRIDHSKLIVEGVGFKNRIEQQQKKTKVKQEKNL